MSNPETSPFRKKGFIAAAIVVGVIALAAIIVLVTSVVGGSNGAPSPAPTSSPDSSATAEPVEDPSVCGLEGFETENTLDAAPDVDWVLVGTIAAPTSEDAGPAKIDEGFRSCYAHTAEGALLLAANFIAMGTDATLGPRLFELVAPGPGRDVLENAPSGSSASSRAQIAGYKIGSYSENAATVDLVLNYSDGSLVSLPMKLLWVEGDWKVELTPAGELPLAPARIDNLGGYTPWSGA